MNSVDNSKAKAWVSNKELKRIVRAYHLIREIASATELKL